MRHIFENQSAAEARGTDVALGDVTLEEVALGEVGAIAGIDTLTTSTVPVP